MSGMMRILAIMSPSSTESPASTNSFSTMPETWGLISTSLRGTTEPVAIVFLMIVVVIGLCVS